MRKIILLIFVAITTWASNPDMLITEFTMCQARKIEGDKIVKRWESFGLCYDVMRNQQGYTILCGLSGIWSYSADNIRHVIYESKSEKTEVFPTTVMSDGNILFAVSSERKLYVASPEGLILKEYNLYFLNPEVDRLISSVVELRNGMYLIYLPGRHKLIWMDPFGRKRKQSYLHMIAKKFKTKRFHKITELDNGNLLVSTGLGRSLVELDSRFNIRWSLTPKDVPSLDVPYISGAKRLENGNTIVTAYGGKTPIFEVTKDKKVLWKIDQQGKKGIYKPTNLQLLN